MTTSTLRNLLGSADPARSLAVLIRPIQSFPLAGPLAHEVPSNALKALPTKYGKFKNIGIENYFFPGTGIKILLPRKVAYRRQESFLGSRILISVPGKK